MSIRPEDVAAVAPELRSSMGPEGQDMYRAVRQVFQKSPEAQASFLVPLLLTDYDAGEAGRVEPTYYQVPFVGHALAQTWDFLDALWPTGMGKTIAASMAGALRMYFRPFNGVIIANQEDQTKYIRDQVHSYYANGHQLFRDALQDSAQDRVVIRRPNGDLSRLICRTANVSNDGNSLLGLQGFTDIFLDERSILPDHIMYEKVDRITAPNGVRRFMTGITTTQEANHVYDWCEAWKLPKREACDPTVPHLTRLVDGEVNKMSGAVFKGTWRDGVRAGRYSLEDIERKHKQMGQDRFDSWYECDFPTTGGEKLVPLDLWHQLIGRTL